MSSATDLAVEKLEKLQVEFARWWTKYEKEVMTIFPDHHQAVKQLARLAFLEGAIKVNQEILEEIKKI